MFFVDAPPATDDLYYKNAWHTWLVGGLGPGGRAIYMLDVTDPKQFNESNAAALVIGEWTPSSISCTGTNGSNCGTNLGNTYGAPVIRRLHNGTWGVIFGNGYGSTSGDAGIFIMTVDPTTAAKTFYYLSTGKTGSNGIASPSPADYDGDHITDYVYAGDLLGNVWRFDLTNSDPTKWGVTSTGGAATPLFTEPTGQAITTKVNVGSGAVQGLPRVMIDFGTGLKTPLTNASAATYSAGVHRLYGIWDWNMSSWNSKSTARLDSMNSGPSAITLANLQVQTLTVNNNGDLDGTNNPVCWADQASCSTTPAYGWYITLLNHLEQVIFNPVQYGDILLVNTTVPADNSPLSCKNTADTGYTIAISLATGGSIKGLFPLHNDDMGVGSLTNGSGSPFIVLADKYAFMITQTLGGGAATGLISCVAGSLVCNAPIAPQGPVGKRLTWTQRR
jgi:type IV pilus assembly protein PilY1